MRCNQCYQWKNIAQLTAASSAAISHSATVLERLRVYREKTEPLVDYFERQGLLRRIDGSRAADAVSDQIRATLSALRFEQQT